MTDIVEIGYDVSSSHCMMCNDVYCNCLVSIEGKIWDFSRQKREQDIVYLLKKHSTKQTLFKSARTLFNDTKKKYQNAKKEWDNDVRKELKYVEKLKEDVIELNTNIELLKCLDEMIMYDEKNMFVNLKYFLDVVKETKKHVWRKKCSDCVNSNDIVRFNSKFKWSYRTRKIAAVKLSKDISSAASELELQGYSFNMLTISPRNIEDLTKKDIDVYNKEILHYFFKHKKYTDVVKGQVMITEIKDHIKGDIKPYTKHWDVPLVYDKTEFNFHNHLIIAYREEDMNEDNQEEIQQSFRNLYELTIEKRITSYEKKINEGDDDIKNKETLKILHKFKKSYHVTISEKPEEKEIKGITKYLLHYVTKGIDVTRESLKTLITEFKGLKMYSVRGVFTSFRELCAVDRLRTDLNEHFDVLGSRLVSGKLRIEKKTTNDVICKSIDIEYDVNKSINLNLHRLFRKEKGVSHIIDNFSDIFGPVVVVSKSESQVSKQRRAELRKIYYERKHSCSGCGSCNMVVDRDGISVEMTTEDLEMYECQKERSNHLMMHEGSRTTMTWV